ncbi:MAG: HD domain-containing protein [Candidatus Berkiellales bacterium]
MSERLKKQLSFLYEIDKLKAIVRKTNLICDPSRLENSAEHSWHLAMYAMILAEYANEKIDILRVIKMVLIHDLVEIYAGDTFCYDNNAYADKEDKEQFAAQCLFALLPDDQHKELINLWHEFEKRETMEAKFADCVDRLQPLLHNYASEGGTWKRHDIKHAQVEKRTELINEASFPLGDLVRSILDESVAKNYLAK